VDTISGHNVGGAAEDIGGSFLDVHQLEKSEFSLFLVEEQVHVGVLSGFPPSGRTKEVQMFDTKLP